MINILTLEYSSIKQEWIFKDTKLWYSIGIGSRPLSVKHYVWPAEINSLWWKWIIGFADNVAEVATAKWKKWPGSFCISVYKTEAVLITIRDYLQSTIIVAGGKSYTTEKIGPNSRRTSRQWVEVTILLKTDVFGKKNWLI